MAKYDDVIESTQDYKKSDAKKHKQNEPTQRVTVNLAESQWMGLKFASIRNKQSMTSIIESLVEDYLEAQEGNS